MGELLGRESVGRDDVQRVALDRAHERKGHAGAASRVLDHATTGAEATVGFRRLNDRERHPVLQAAGWILAFDFQEHSAGPDAPQPHQGRVPDAAQDRQGSLAPITLIWSMVGGDASNSGAFAIRALAIGPFRWACRPRSS